MFDLSYNLIGPSILRRYRDNNHFTAFNTSYFNIQNIIILFLRRDKIFQTMFSILIHHIRNIII